MEYIKLRRFCSRLAPAAALLFTAVIFIGIGIELPWAILPAAGGVLLTVGYNWGYKDAAGNRHLQAKRIGRKCCAPAAAGYAGGRERSGDSYNWVTMPDGRFTAALSDGMGKGVPAAEESSLAVKIITGMLQAGLGPETALKLLNMTFMIHGGRECYSTMDLAVLDPADRELHLYKIGAAATVVRRSSGRVDILAAPAMPMGVMEYDRIPCVSTMVAAGDQIIMMTDGVIDSKRDTVELQWLKGLISGITSNDPQTICDLILREAVANYGDREKDDMTVLVFTVG